MGKTWRQKLRTFNAPSARLTIVIILCLWGLFLRYQSRAAKDLWLDERMQLAHMEGSFHDMLRTIPQREYFGYLEGDFYVIYPFFKMFGYNKWGLCLPHILSTVLGFYLVYLIGQRYFKTIWGYLVSFSVIALNATLIQHAFEIRVNAVLPTLALAYFYFAQDLIGENASMPLFKKLAIGILTVIIIWFHVYGIFIVFFTTMYLLGTLPKDDRFKIILMDLAKFFGVVLLMALPFWGYCVFFQHLDYATQYRLKQNLLIAQPRDVYQFIPNPLLNLKGFLKAVLGNLIGQKFLYPLYLGLIISFLLPHRERLNQIGFFLILIIWPIATIHLMDLRNGYWFVQRQFLWTMPFLAILLGWTWETLILYAQGHKLNLSEG